MPVFKDFSENAESTGSHYEPLTNDNIDRYLKEQGKDKAEGYLDAMSDFLKQIDLILDTPVTGGSYPNSPAAVRRELDKFFKEKKIVLQILEPTIKAFDQSSSAANNKTNISPLE